MSDNKNETTGGAVIGFQVPLQLKQRKGKIDELLSQTGLTEGDILTYFKLMGDRSLEQDCRDLDEGNFDGMAGRVREFVVREMVRSKIREVVRKKEGGGGYVLFSPNKGKKKNPKPVGSFPTKLGAKRAELARFPPQDPQKLKRLRKQVDRLTKDPKKRAEKEAQDARARKKEGLDLLRSEMIQVIHEALFREERTGSEWDDMITKFSRSALEGDKKFQNLMKNIEKRTQKALEGAYAAISRSVDKKKVKLKDFGVKKSDDGRSYMAFAAMMDNVEVAPIYLYIEAGRPKIEVSDTAKAALTKTDPKNSKMFRAELVTVQERVLDNMDDLERAIEARDSYLTRLQDEADGVVSEMSPLQLSLLKVLLVKKYRKV